MNGGSPAILDNMGAFTVSAWVYPETLDNSAPAHMIAHKNDVCCGTTAVNGWYFGIIGTGQLAFEADYATANLIRRTGNNIVILKAWQHVAMTWNGSATAGNVRLYRNGVEVSSYSINTNGVGTRLSDATANFRIGNSAGAEASRGFDGTLDEVRVYNRALSGNEINGVFNEK